MIRIIIALSALLICVRSYSQDGAALAVAEGGQGLVKTNITSIYEHTWKGESDYFSLRGSYEFVSSKHFTLSGNMRYSIFDLKFRDNWFQQGANVTPAELNGDHHVLNAGINASFRTMLWGKPFISLAMVTSDFDKKGFRKIGGIAAGLFMLRLTRDTQFGFGLLALVNSNSKCPVFPMFIYRHRFNDLWAINLSGGMFTADFTPSRNDIINIGADIDVRSFYFNPSSPALHETCKYQKSVARPMIRYRRKLGRHFYTVISGGVELKLTSRVYYGVSDRKNYMEVDVPTSPFGSISAGYTF